MRLEIPAINVDTGFEYLGLTQDKAMDAPKDPDKVGWYKMGPKPGAMGNALIDGHVDWGQKTRVFWGLRNLKPGDSVIITDKNGHKYEFAVQWSKWYDANAPVQEAFAQSDQTEVTLITCGGEFDHTTRQYLSRLVVRAKLK